MIIPSGCRQCDDSPVVFFFKGTCDLNSPKILSVVGTRSATPRGKELCDKIIGGLATGHPDLIIVSGLAYGIDIASHKAALSNNLQTVGVLAHGLNTIYPAIHRSTSRSNDAKTEGFLPIFFLMPCRKETISLRGTVS